MRGWHGRLLLGIVAFSACLGVAQAPVFQNDDRWIPDETLIPPGTTFLAQKITVTNSTQDTLSLLEVQISNLIRDPTLSLDGNDISSIEVRVDGQVLGKETDVGDIAGAGVRIQFADPPLVAPNETLQLEIWVALFPVARDGRSLRVGSNWTYQVGVQPLANSGWVEASAGQIFEVKWVLFANDPEVGGQSVYPDQPFLAQRVIITNSSDWEIRLDELKVANFAAEVPLPGDYLKRIEVRRASDGRLMGQQTNANELRNFLEDAGGVRIRPTAINRIPAHSQVKVEVWITIKDDSPPNYQVLLGTRFDYTPENLLQERSGWIQAAEPQTFTVGQARGLEEVENVALTNRNVYGDQRFMAQRISLQDLDPDPYSVTLGSFLVQNVALAGTRLAEDQIAKIEVIRAHDGAIIGSTTNPQGLNTGGVRINATSNREITDDTGVMVEVWITLKPTVPDGRQIKLNTTVWHEEDESDFDGTAYGNAVFTTGPAPTGGVEVAEALRTRERPIYLGETFVVQRLRLTDDDTDPYDVTLSSFVIRNVPSDSPLADHMVERIEIRRADTNALLGQTTDLRGFGVDGVRVITGANNELQDDTAIEIIILVKIRATASVGRKIKLETVVWYEEGPTVYTTRPLVGPGEFETKVNEPPVASFTYEPRREIRWNTLFTFDPSESTDPDGDLSLATFEWNFGDGSEPVVKSGPELVKHSYGKGGRFTVRLTITDEGGETSTATLTLDVPPNAPPTGVNFSWTPQSPKWSDEVTFTPARGIQDPDGDISQATFEWDFGDGSPKVTTIGPSPVKHCYGQGGQFTVVLTVIDEGGEETEKSHALLVSNLPPTGVDFSWSPQQPNWDQEVTFTPARGIEDPDGNISKATFQWNFGDGSTPVTTIGPTQVSHRFGRGGRFTVTLTVIDEGGGQSEKSWPISVSNLPPTGVDFAFNPAAPRWDETVVFTPAEEIVDPDGDINRATFRWDFGDGSPPTLTTGPAEVEHVFGKGGTFAVTLTVVDEGQASVSQEKEITVSWLVVDFTWEPENPRVGDPVTFTAQVTFPEGEAGDAAALYYLWEFGDEEILEGEGLAEVEHVYQRAGAYTVTLTVTHSKGPGFATHDLTVTTRQAPIITRLEVTPAVPEVQQEVTFIATVQAPENDPIVGWEWDFGDGTTSTHPSPVTHAYTADGVYEVRVRAKNEGGGWSAWYSLTLFVRRPGAAAIGTRLTQNPVAAEAVIEFFAPEGATDLRLRVFDLLGRPVFESTTPTRNRFRWDLTDSGGDPVPNGLYFYLVTAVLDGRTIRSEVGRILVLR